LALPERQIPPDCLDSIVQENRVYKKLLKASQLIDSSEVGMTDGRVRKAATPQNPTTLSSQRDAFGTSTNTALNA